jgi:hypothetical protein
MFWFTMKASTFKIGREAAKPNEAISMAKANRRSFRRISRTMVVMSRSPIQIRKTWV